MRMEIHPFPLVELHAAWEALKGRFTINENGCWIANHASSNGYGYLNFDGEPRTGHSVAYEKLTGERYRKSDALELDHKCKIKRCWNPFHLEPVTRQVNFARGFVRGYNTFNSSKTHCKRGHPFDEENTYIDKKGQRNCRECMRAKWRRLHPPGWKNM